MNKHMLATPKERFAYSGLARNIFVLVVFFLFFLLPFSPFQAAKSDAVPQAPTTEALDTDEAAAFTQAMAGLYRSPEPLVRVLSYINTIKIPHSTFLEKELRERLTERQSKTEQYIILYALASISHSDQDCSALLKHSFRFPYVVSYASAAEEGVRVGGFLSANLYPWMAHNTIYKRDAWLRGLICADYICGTLSTEARSDYLAYFPEDLPSPEYWRSDDMGKVYELIGLSQPEIAWLQGGKPPPEEDKWLASCEMPYMDDFALSQAWERTFDTFLPVITSEGKDAELVRRLVAPTFKFSISGGKYDSLFAK